MAAYASAILPLDCSVWTSYTFSSACGRFGNVDTVFNAQIVLEAINLLF